MPRNDHDIFVSYAHVDDECPPNVNKGWVSFFIDGLKHYLAKELGRKDRFSLWMDYELRGNQPITGEIEETLAGAHTLVLFLSNGYVESEWCQRELALFVERVGAVRGRIFPVQLMPVADTPTCLQELGGYQLWVADGQTTRPLGDPVPDPTELAYYRHLRELAADLAGALRQTPRGPSLSEELVFVNGGIQDTDLIRAMADELRKAGIAHSVPISTDPAFDPETADITAVEHDLEEKLDFCDQVLLVHKRAPAAQIGQLIKLYFKAKAKRRERPPSGIAVCKTDPAIQGYGIHLPDLLLLQVEEPPAERCMQRFLERAAK